MESIKWLDKESGIIHWQIGEDQTADDILAGCNVFREMSDSVSIPLYPILDFTTLKNMRTDIVLHFPEMGRRLPLGENRAPFVVVVSRKMFIKTLINIFSGLFKDTYLFFPTLEMALGHIAKHQQQSINRPINS